MHRLDHPDERVTLAGWPRGDLPAKSKPSPYATVWLRRGAFGVTWVERIRRRPLAIADKPLFGDFYAGKGTALLVVTLPSGTVPDAREVKLRAQFMAALQEVADTGAISSSAVQHVVDVFAEDEPPEVRELYAKFNLAEATAAQPLAPRLSLLQQVLSHQYLHGIGLESDDDEALNGSLEDIASDSKEKRKAAALRARRRLSELFADFDRQSALRAWIETLQRKGPPSARVVVVWGAPFVRSFDAACGVCSVLNEGETNTFGRPWDGTVDWDVLALVGAKEEDSMTKTVAARHALRDRQKKYPEYRSSPCS